MSLCERHKDILQPFCTACEFEKQRAMEREVRQLRDNLADMNDALTCSRAVLERRTIRLRAAEATVTRLSAQANPKPEDTDQDGTDDTDGEEGGEVVL